MSSRHIAASLTDSVQHMDSSSAGILHCWLNACEGIIVWNLVGAAVQNKHKDAALAQRLERWLWQYEQQWMQVSKPSELWRIREMVRWYAALLRTF